MIPLEHVFTETFPASRERVFHALTDESELCAWFAEHVEVQPQAGGEFRFWGRHTYCAPTRASAGQKLLRIEPPTLLVFSWPLDGCASEVTLELAEGPQDAAGAPTTVLKGRHYFPETPAVPRPLDLVDDLWRMAVSNLRAHLAGIAVCRADFSDPVPHLRQSVLIDRPRDRVFDALLDPAALDQWIATKAVVEPHVGGRYSYGWQYEVRGRQVEGGPTKILELVEDTCLVTDWPDWRGNPEMPSQRVMWLLESIGPRTRVFVIQSPFERTADLSDYPQGWAHFLGRLKQHCEAASSA